MPKGTGGQTCTDIFEIRMMLASDPDYRFELVALDARNVKPIRMDLAEFDLPGNRERVEAFRKLSPCGHVAVQYP